MARQPGGRGSEEPSWEAEKEDDAAAEAQARKELQGEASLCVRVRARRSLTVCVLLHCGVMLQVGALGRVEAPWKQRASRVLLASVAA